MKRRFTHYFSINLSNPLFLLWATWLASLAICAANIFTAYSPLSITTVLAILTFLICISFGYWYGYQFHIDKIQIHYSGMRLYEAFNVLFWLVVAVYVLTIYKLGLPPIFSGVQRSTYYLSGGGELIYLLIFPCFYLGIFIVYHHLLPQLNFWIIAQLLVMALMIMMKSNKMTIFTIMLMLCFFFGRHVNWTLIIIMVAAVVFVFSFASITYTKNITNLTSFEQQRYALTGFSLPEYLNFLYDPFIYLSSNLYNVNTLLQSNLSGTGLGSLSFHGIIQIIGAFDPSFNQLNDQARHLINMSATIPNFSTYSALGELFYDFGMPVALEISTIIGFFSGLFINEKHNILINDFLAFILYQTIVLSFFTIYLGNLEVITNLVVMLAVDKFGRLSNTEAPHIE